MAARPVADVISEQVGANASAEGERAAFASHRARLTRLLVERARPNASLCVLGAGNCHDLELATLLEHYGEIHLVDLDPAALERARSRLEEGGERIVAHAPLDVSGVLDKLERWAAFRVTPEELIGHGDATARSVAAALGASFDVVLSSCLLTQIQRAPVAVLGDKHPLFEAVRHTLSVTHLRVLRALLGPEGRALLVTDVTADRIAKLPESDGGESLVPLLDELVRTQAVFQVAQPELLKAMVRDDPVLASSTEAKGPLDAWLWQNGPHERFLVAALELVPRR